MEKSDLETSFWAPLEAGSLVVQNAPAGSRVRLFDGVGGIYSDLRARSGEGFCVRGAPGAHAARLAAADGQTLAEVRFSVRARTRISCEGAPYGKLAERLENLLRAAQGNQRWVLRGKPRLMFVDWGRDHVHTLKAMKYFEADVTSGIDYWLETQEANGMVWDCIAENPTGTAPSWFGEALGEGFFRYEEDGRYVVRRIPVEADCEFLYAEGVWQAWKATGDDAWMRLQLPRLEKALRYNTSHPDRWSRRHRLVRRSFCMDSWDFANPHYCSGDHRRINPGDPQFLFHGDNSGLYAFHWMLAEMQEHAGDRQRAEEILTAAASLRERANKKLFFGTAYGHMIPEKLDPEKVYSLVGDERRRLSFSLGYTMNRGLPTHEMAVKILNEFRRRGKKKASTSFAEWFAIDPPYTEAQWPGTAGESCAPGEYMNGGISPVVAGELARAAFEHGMEDYGADILRRVWELTERDGRHLHDTYRQVPKKPALPRAEFRFLDLRPAANRGLCHGAFPGVPAWTDEGDNDMRNLPVGRRRFGAIRFDVMDPARNAGRAVVHLAPCAAADISAGDITATSLYFLHAFSGRTRPGDTVAVYEIEYADGSRAGIPICLQKEIASWWNPTDQKALEAAGARIAWRGPNPQWKDVGVSMFGWNNAHPEKPIRSVRARSVRGELMLLAISASDQPVAFEPRIRSGGLPACWGQAAVYHAVAEGLAGITDAGRGFDHVSITPRWAAAGVSKADVCLHYPASGACCAYSYRHGRGRIALDFAGGFQSASIRCLLPTGRRAAGVASGRTEIPFTQEHVGKSCYARFAISGIISSPIVIRLADKS
ncbi:MAG: hypothetical protein WCS65_13090 [Verrucomicrobiae bacterium]